MKIFKNTSFIPIWILLGVFLFLAIASMQHESVTTDERAHLTYGFRILKFNSDKSERFTAGKMPFSALNALPGVFRLLGQSKRNLNSKQATLSDNDLRNGRYATIFFSLLVSFYVFRWAKELYGNSAGYLALLLYVFCPNILAHSQLVTTDLYLCGMATITTYYFWKFIKFRGRQRLFASAITLGLAQLSKYSAIFLWPIFALIIAVRWAAFCFLKSFEEASANLRGQAMFFLKTTFYFMAVSIFVINLGFIFHKSLTPLGDYHFESTLFKKLQSPNFIRPIPVPLPMPYLQGLDRVRHYERENLTFGNIYLLGHLRGRRLKNYQGFKGYYLIATFFKMPIATQLFIFISIVVYLRRIKNYDFFNDEIFLFIPALFFTVYFNFFNAAQIGIRYFLVVFPFLFIFCGSLLKEGMPLDFRKKTVVIGLIAYLVISHLSYFPHYLSYFNEWVGDRKNAYKILADSNLDWKQNRWYLARYLEKNPQAVVNPRRPRPGRIVVDVNHLVGVSKPERYRWLRDHFEPTDHIAYSYLVFDVSPEALSQALQEENNRRQSASF